MSNTCPQQLLEGYLDKHEVEGFWLTRVEISDSVHCDTWVDDGEGYKKEGHPLWLWFRNGYNIEEDVATPIAVSNNPQLVFDVPLKISLAEFNTVRGFIIENVDFLKRLADMEFGDSGDTIEQVNLICERKRHGFSLDEMANLSGGETGTGRRIWLDRGETYKKGGHGPRVKAYLQDFPNISVSFGVDDNVTPFHDIPEKEMRPMEKVRTWIGYNLRLIRDFMSGGIDITDFKKRMVVLDKNGKPMMPSERYGYIYKNIGDGYSIFVHPVSGKFNICKNKDMSNPLCPAWFDGWGKYKIDKNGEHVILIWTEDATCVFYIERKLLEYVV